MSALLALVLTAATAQEANNVNAQLYAPPIDSTRTLWLEDSVMLPNKSVVARGMFSYTNKPLVYVKNGETTNIVSDVLQLDLAAGMTFGRVRFGVDVPVYLLSSGEAQTGAGLGDLRLDAKLGILDHDEAPLGLALTGRTDLPTATVDLPLGSGKVAGEFAVVVDRPIGDLLLAADVGLRIRPEAVLENVTLNDALIYRFGGAYAFSDEAGASLEFAGNTGFGTQGTGAGSPLEGLVGGYYRMPTGLTFRGGVGTGITRGIGSPLARVMFMLGYEPRAAEDMDLDGLVDDIDNCPQDPEDFDEYEDTDGCPDPDNDGDGLLDTADTCPMEPEDMDSWEDEDGCPEPEFLVRWSVVDPAGNAVSGARYVLPDGDSFEAPTEAGWLPGIYEVSAEAEGYDTNTRDVTLEMPGPQDLVTVLTPKVTMGTLTVKVVDKNGEPVEGASFSLVGVQGDHATGSTLSLAPADIQVIASAEGYAEVKDSGTIKADTQTDLTIELARIAGELLVEVVGPDGKPIEGATFTLDEEGENQSPGEAVEVAPGELTVIARAEGYAPGKATATVVADEAVTVRIALEASRIKVTKTQITLEEKVFFKTGRADIQSQSFAMLDELAQVIQDHPELTKIKIEGHTDSRGSESSNLALSERRAASVRTYLIGKGVEGERLVSEGYGESKPLDPAENAEAWEKNRRVDIFILERDDD
ncbi:MAG: OmpA family protein [Proteobacteria bacterium]|nr:OmpA family protein [Pseudomonadota bacterium]